MWRYRTVHTPGIIINNVDQDWDTFFLELKFPNIILVPNFSLEPHPNGGFISLERVNQKWSDLIGLLKVSRVSKKP